MTDKKFSALTAKAVPVGTDAFAIVDNSSTPVSSKKTTFAQVIAAITGLPLAAVTAPTGTGIVKIIAGAWAAAAATLVDADVSASAAIAGTKVAPAFGAQNISTTGTLTTGATHILGTTPAATGTIRLPSTASLMVRGAGNVSDYNLITSGAADTCVIGDASVGYVVMRAYSGGFIYNQIAGLDKITVGATALQVVQPIIGDSAYSSPYSVHGGVSFAFLTDLNYTVTAAQLAFQFLEFTTGAWTATHTVIFPLPTSVARGYGKTISNATAYAMTISVGAGTTQSIPAGAVRRFWFDSTGVRALDSSNFGADNLVTTGYASIGATPATAGSVRFPSAGSLQFRNGGNSADENALSWSAGSFITVGQSTTAENIYLKTGNGGYTQIRTGAAANNAFTFGELTNKSGTPILGDDTQPSAYGVHGGVSITFASDANHTVTAAQYSFDYIDLQQGSWTATHSVIFPLPSSAARGYYKTVSNSTPYNATISVGSGSTVVLTPLVTRRVYMDSSGVRVANTDFVPFNFKPSSLAVTVGAATTAGSDTVAVQFYCPVTSTIHGIRFYWANAGTVKLSLWDAGSSRVTSVTVVVAAAGVVEALFATPVSITAMALYRVSAWQTDGVSYTKTTQALAAVYWPGGNATLPTFMGGPGYVTITKANLFAGGDAAPGTAAGAEAYLLEPIISSLVTL